MKGASGAGLDLAGDLVTKTCKDAQDQVNWFKTAKPLLPDGIRTPRIWSSHPSYYTMEFVSGHEATRESSLHPIINCQQLAEHGPSGGTIDSYVERCEDHVRQIKTCWTPQHPASFLMKWLERDAHLLQPGFCHGDLTLENVMVGQDSLVVIDPNNKPGLFMSPALDHGKLLQSTHAHYHDVFDSHKGCSLTRHAQYLEKYLLERDEWKPGILACATHILRLRKYNPCREHLADDILEQLLQNYS